MLKAKREKGTQETYSQRNSQGNSKLPLVQENWLYAPQEHMSGRNFVRLNKSYCGAFTGYRGAGKTFSLAYVGAKALANNMTVFANFRIAFWLKKESGKKVLCESRPLDMDALYTLDEGIQNAVVLLMEMQNFVPSRRSMTLKNMLFNAIVQQMRHRSLSLFYDCKFLEMVDSQIRWETDIEMQCRDAAHTNWGMESGFTKEGELIFWTPIDWSGLWTHSLTPTKLHDVMVKVAPLQGIYNTHENIDFLETMAPIYLDRKPVGVGGNGHDEEDFEFSNEDRNKIAKLFKEKNKLWFNEIAAKMGISGRWEREQLRNLLFTMGYDMSKSGGDAYFTLSKASV